MCFLVLGLWGTWWVGSASAASVSVSVVTGSGSSAGEEGAGFMEKMASDVAELGRSQRS